MAFTVQRLPDLDVGHQQLLEREKKQTLLRDVETLVQDSDLHCAAIFPLTIGTNSTRRGGVGCGGDLHN